MPNEENLMPIEEVNSRRTREEHSNDSRKAGIASGAARRRKRSLRETADLYLSLPVSDRRRWNKIARHGVEPEDVDNQMAMIIGMVEAATLGDARAAKVVIDMLGEDARSGAEENAIDSFLAATKPAEEDVEALYAGEKTE